jgi:hypothetical protein
MSEASATPSAAPLLLGRYRVTEQLGETRLAVVYTATDERLHRRVLLHLLRKDLVGQERPRARFVAEAAQMARRSHAALLEVFDSGEAGGRPYLVTEHCTGRPLRGLGVLTVEQAILYLRQVTGAVAACQAVRTPELPVGLYHPPISSSNVILVDEGRIKLVDSWDHAPAALQADLAHYRAPELSEGQPPGTASAVYALGVLLYELIVGARPITGPDPRATALAHLTTRVPPLHVARPALYLPAAERLVARATARLPEQRFADAQAFGDALDALWRDLGAATLRLAPPPAAPRLGRQQPAALGAAPAPPPVAPAAPTPRPAPVAGRAAPAPAPTAGPRRRAITEMAQTITGRWSRQLPVDPDLLRRRNFTHGLTGWLVMMGLVGLVAVGAYVGVNALADRVTGRPLPNVPGLPTLPEQPSGGLGGWLDGLLGDETIMVVNIAEGLNMRDAAGLNSTVFELVPNGTLVQILEGPTIVDNIPWVRARAEIGDRQVEGWLSMNYLRPKE